MSFEDITGQSKVKRLLQSCIVNNKISHSYIFEGQEGIGKKTMSRAFSRAILCNQSGGDACGVCKDCIMTKALTHPDLFIYRVSEDKKSIGVEVIRELLREVYTKPYSAQKKVFIIEDAMLLTDQAQNALLKIFEEPPAYAVFILITQSLTKLLSTVRSRAVAVSFTQYTNAEVLAYLEKNIPQLREQYDFLIAYSGNNIGRAIQLATSEGFIALRQKLYNGIRSLIGADSSAVYGLVTVFEEYKDEADALLECMQSLFRDVLFSLTQCEGYIINSDYLSLINKISDNTTAGGAVKVIEAINQTKQMHSRYVNYNLLVMPLLLGSWEEINVRNSRSAV